MELYSSNNNYKLYKGDMRNMLDVIGKESIDAVLTDPPYELNFMSKGWDNAGVSFQKETWEKCYKILKPGGYLLAFGGSRTFHRIACAIEDAGFEIRDTIMWLYGSGFPKSMNIGLAIDKKNGVKSKIIGERKQAGAKFKLTQELIDNGGFNDPNRESFTIKEAQNKWKGWGSALKPSYEPIIIARKPFKGSLVDNVIEWGVGGINIDECRVEAETNGRMCGSTEKSGETSFILDAREETYTNQGRFPANTILTYDETDFDEVCGGFPNSKGFYRPNCKDKSYNQSSNIQLGGGNVSSQYNDSGSASRYFYCAKASKKDRDEGLDEFEQEKVNDGRNTPIDNAFQIGNERRTIPINSKDTKSDDSIFTELHKNIQRERVATNQGRFPANTILTYDETDFDEVCGGFPETKSTNQTRNNTSFTGGVTRSGNNNIQIKNYNTNGFNDSGSASRYFYCAKASKKDRDEGLEDFEEQKVNDGRKKDADNAFQRGTTLRHNIHPTVKPTTLMQYLVRLVSPKGATILDPFMGSGSTGKAIMYENKERNANYKFIGIEQNEEYCRIAKARIEYVINLKEENKIDKS